MKDKLTKLRQQGHQLATELRAMLDKADAREQPGLTEEEQTQYNEKKAQLDALKRRIEDEEELEAQERWLDSPETRAETPAGDLEDDDDDGQGEGEGEGQGEGQAGRREIRVDRDREAARPFRSFGEQLVAIVRAGSPEGRESPDKRLLRLNAEHRAATGLSEGVQSEGGFLVQQDFVATILERTYAVGQILNRIARLPLGPGKNGTKLPAVDESSRKDGFRKGGVRAYWTEEAGEKTASKPKFRLMELALHKLAALVYATDDLLDDATLLEAWIMRELPGELRFVGEDAILNGDGVGKPFGILESPAVIEQAIEPTQTIANTADFLAKNVAKMFSRLYVASMPNAVWLINQQILADLIVMTIGGTGGTPVYLPGGTMEGAPFGALLGRPVLPIEYAEAVGTPGDIALVDLTEYAMIEKGGIQAASSIHVRFIYDETTFRFVWRLDGQPTWDKALTPFKGSATVSPYVTLAARS